MVKFKFLAQFPMDPFAYPVMSTLILILRWFLHSLIMWLMVSSLSLHNLHLLFCCILSIHALIWLVLILLFCAAIRRDSVFLLRFPFLGHIHVFSFEMLLISHLKHSCFSSHFCFLVIVVVVVIIIIIIIRWYNYLRKNIPFGQAFIFVGFPF